MGRKGVVLTIGVFDGFHRGHRSLVRETVRLARRGKAKAAALTFTNHPLNVLHHEGRVAFLVPRRETYAALQGAGIDRVLAVPFTRRYACQTPERFVGRLVRRLGLKAVVVGANFRFGAGNRGDIGTLERLGRRFGFRVCAVRLRGGRGGVSSSRIRKALRSGRVEEANRMLGRPFHISGRVTKGRHVGRRMGYPTANLTDLRCFVPKEGIYACSVLVGRRTYRGGLDLGTRPTIRKGDHRLRAEVHLIGFRGSLYGRRIEIRLLRYLRPERRFHSMGALARQIRRDIVAIRRTRG